MKTSDKEQMMFAEWAYRNADFMLDGYWKYNHMRYTTIELYNQKNL
jgi:hypothetical protein